MSTTHEHLKPLAEAVRKREVILFAGGGVSQNLGLPSFEELIDHVAEEMKLSRTDFAVSDYPVLSEAYVQCKGGMAELRDWMNRRWHPKSLDVSQSAVHNLIVDLNFRKIYTTNYDHWLEAAYDKRNIRFRKIANIADLAQPPDDCTKIIKFHGDFDDDETLVLTETSYFERMSFETPLDILLRADSLASPLLFIGYSLHDVNMRYLLFRLHEIWKASEHLEKRPRSYIFMPQPDPAQEIVLRSRHVEPLVMPDEDPGKATQRFLEALLELARSA